VAKTIKLFLNVLPFNNNFKKELTHGRLYKEEARIHHWNEYIAA